MALTFIADGSTVFQFRAGVCIELDTPPPSLVTGEPTTENCAHGEGRRMMYFHGTDDFVCPYEGTGPEWYDPPREETARRWARHNRCANEDPEIEDKVELRKTRHCRHKLHKNPVL